MFELLKAKGLYFYRALRTSLLHSLARSDIERWGQEANLNPSWDTRTKLIASLIPAGSSVLEFGAGRMALKRSLPASCRYTPSDIVDRGAGTIVCDLNQPVLPPFQFHNIVVFGGVLEYIFNLDNVLAHLANSCDVIIASYATTDFPGQQSTLQRRKYGWVNNFGREDFLNLFFSHGFTLGQALSWENQYVFRFVKYPQTSDAPK